jgi:acyl-CoA reductase-like NAD-dependent aldehyde dehydrogenase
MIEGTTLPLLRGGRWYVSRDTATVPGGAHLSLAPPIMIRDDAVRLRRARRAWRPLPPAERRAILSRAADVFRRAPVHVEGLGTQDFDDFAAAMRVCAGLPRVLVERWTDLLFQRPAEPPDVPTGEGATLVSLPANTFTCLQSVLDALATGGAVWIRPSRREPFSSARLVGALLAAGWPAERLGYYPTAPSALPALIAATGRQVVYGGEGLAGDLAEAPPTLDLHGPGRACFVLPEGPPPDPAPLADELLDLIARDAGRFCVNVSIIAGTGDLGPLANRLAALLDHIPLDPHPDPRPGPRPEPRLGRPLDASCGPPLDRPTGEPAVRPRLPLASVAAAEAERMARFVTGRLAPGGRLLTRRPLVLREGGRTYLAPTLVQVDRADHPLVGCELPFPFAVVVATDAAGIRDITSRSLFVYPEGPARPEGTLRREGPGRPQGAACPETPQGSVRPGTSEGFMRPETAPASAQEGQHR